MIRYIHKNTKQHGGQSKYHDEREKDFVENYNSNIKGPTKNAFESCTNYL